MTDVCASPNLISLEDALCTITEALPSQTAYESLPLKRALNRITYNDLYSNINVPSFRNSSMDGYALSTDSDLTQPLTVIDTSWAGKPYKGDVPLNSCVRIFTGAYVPVDCNCVVMQENTERKNNSIVITASPQVADNIREIGSDINSGGKVLSKHSTITAANIGLLAASGISDVAVYKRLNIGFFSTGDELASLGTTLNLGQIYDSNRYTLAAMIEQSGANPIDMGVIPDDPTAVEAALLSASKQCDVIITSGGVSVGEADFITTVLNKIGQINLWKIAIKPGKPLVFGSINDAIFFGLPGNPVSVMVTYQQVVEPAIRKMMGHDSAKNPLSLVAKTTTKLLKEPGRKEFQRGVVEQINGELVVTSTGKQDSHMLQSMAKANCFIILDADTATVNKGEEVSIQLLGNSL